MNVQNNRQGSLRDQCGQITIFFSTTILILITFLAFIINVGVFVKAKINLQNATDAAAYAGASVQARQLSDIAYLNWEMRNVYKEWMFKYYILGGLNLVSVSEGKNSPNQVGTNTSFKMQASKGFSKRAVVDSYNFPSVCIDFAEAGSVGLCTKYLVPGLPRFSSSNVLGMDEVTNAFVDSIVSEKAKDCSRRSQINFFTANAWAYHVNVDDPSLKNISDQAPQIALESGGAFPNAFELALRIRNLEAVVNHAPYESVCANTGTGVNCKRTMDDIIGNPSIGIKAERIAKAYQSGARNLGSESDSEMRASFTLTELAPRPYTDATENSLSTLLIPKNHPTALNKFYVDLKIMPINYATFYTAFAPNTGQYDNIAGAGSPISEGQCTATKIGLPVAGYPLGFVKNQDVLTYYAVKGEANFVGLFNPFSDQFIKLSAFAAAKPFGGRIGPHIFDVKDSTKVFPRENKKSSSYISALDTTNPPDQYGDAVVGPPKYYPGAPLPLNLGTGDKKFWLTRDDPDGAVGGWVPGKEIYFGIPNIPYDFPVASDIQNKGSYSAIQNIEIIQPGNKAEVPKAGLYNKDIFEKLRLKLPGLGSGPVRAQAIQDALIIAKAPTLYDLANYLVPTPESKNAEVGTDSFGTIYVQARGGQISADVSYSIYDANIYAPILDEASIYGSGVTSVQAVLNEYLANLEPAILKYVAAMNLAAAGIYKSNKSSATGANQGEEAARALSDIPDTLLDSADQNAIAEGRPTCKSISGKFAKFILGSNLILDDESDCVTPLQELMVKKWVMNDLNNQKVYQFTYAFPEGLEGSGNRSIFSAYMPGPSQGADANGSHLNPFRGESSNMVRNFYSTKFIPLSSIANGSSSYFYINQIPITSEGSFATGTVGKPNFKNSLNTEQIEVDLSTIKH